MPVLTINLHYEEKDLNKAIEFIMGSTLHVEQVKRESFPIGTPVELVMQNITDLDKRKYLMNNFICGLIVVMEENKKHQKITYAAN